MTRTVNINSATFINFNPHEREARDHVVDTLHRFLIGILIHTSVKLVTVDAGGGGVALGILIHTSVKLVTLGSWLNNALTSILIHTSVKLVTRPVMLRLCPCRHFNPHEREARDLENVLYIVVHFTF